MRFRLSRSLAPYLFAGPAVIAVIVFLYGPIVASALLSVTNWNLLSPEFQLVGADNYAHVFADGDFRLAAWNTLLYCLILIPAQIVLPLLLAMLLYRVRGSRLEGAYRGLLFLPSVVAYSVAGVAWSWLLNPVNGLFNELLTAWGLPRSRWYTDPNLALFCVCLVTFWKNFGLNLLLWTAALINVSSSIRDAARMDGAKYWRRFWDVELPLISPTAFFISVTTLLSVLDDIVGVVDVLTQGGPSGRTSNLLYFLWQEGLHFFQFGTASAVAMIIIIAVLAVTWLQFRLGEKWVHY